MKVILTQEVKALGKKDAVVEVNDGYARNFLLPKKLAIEANASNMNVWSGKMESESKKKERELRAAKALAEKISGIEVVIKTKCGENGKLFGSITTKDIGDTLKEKYKIDIDKKKIELGEPIKNIGVFEIELKVYVGVVAKLNVKVEPA